MGNLIKILLTSSLFLAVIAGLVAAGTVSVYFMAGGGGSISAILASGLVSTIVVLVFKIQSLETRLMILAETTQNAFAEMGDDVSAGMNAQQESHNEDMQEIFGVIAKILDRGGNE